MALNMAENAYFVVRRVGFVSLLCHLFLGVDLGLCHITTFFNLVNEKNKILIYIIYILTGAEKVVN